MTRPMRVTFGNVGRGRQLCGGAHLPKALFVNYGLRVLWRDGGTNIRLLAPVTEGVS